jgi:hypothetical protein
MLNEDYKEMLSILLKNDVRFLVVGAYAMAAYGFPRATGDLDIWVDTTAENAGKVFCSLSEFGAPVFQITETTFTEQGIVFQIGVVPRRIDILTCIDGVQFADAYAAKHTVEIENLKIPFLSKENLIKNKLATGRQKDLVDAEYLKGNYNI